MKASCWSVTINNPTQEDLEAWKNAKMLHFVKEASGQLERGENGTPHIQGLLRTEYVRFSQVKKAFPRAHIEKAKNIFALTQYVEKEETRIGELKANKVATPQVVQERLTSIVEDFIFHKGFPTTWKYTFSRDCTRKVWVQEILYEAEEYQYEFRASVYRNSEWIKDHADMVIDRAVSQLIEEGFFGIEFAIANNQVRNGYKKYLPSIIIRTNAQRSINGATQEARISQSEASDGEAPSQSGGEDCAESIE